MTLPVIISCVDIESVNSQIEKAAFENSANNKGTFKVFRNNFQFKIQNCLDKIGRNDFDYLQCLIDENSKFNCYNYNNTEEKAYCCNRVFNYECMKKYLTSKCGVSKQEVDNNDEEHFAFWNNFNFSDVPHPCIGGRQQSENYCFSDNNTPQTGLIAKLMEIITASTGSSFALVCSIPLQLTVLFVTILMVF